MKLLHRLLFSQTARNSSILLAGNFSDAFFAFLYTLFVFKLLSISQFGIFSTFNNLIFTLVLLLDLGISGSLLLFIPKSLYKDSHQAKFYTTASLWSRFITSFFTSLILVAVFMAGANSFFRHQDPITFLLTGLAIIVISVFDVCIYLLQAHSMFIKSALVTVSFSAIRFVIAFIFLVAHLKLSVNIAIAISALSSIVGIFLTRLWLSLSLFPIPGFPYFSKLITFSGWLGVYRICTTVISRFDIQFVMLFFGPQTTGIYSVAARLANFYPMIIFSLSSIVATKLANPSTKISLVLTLKNIFMGLVCLCAGMILVALMSRQIVGTLFGPTAVESALAYSLLTIAYIPQIILVIPISIITYVFRNPKLVGLLSLLQLAGTIALAFMLTNQFNTYAPAIALLISSSVLLLFTSISIFKKWPTFSLEF